MLTIEAHYSGDLVAVDTFFVGHLKGIGKVYLQTAIDCCSRFAWGRLYTNKMPLTAVHLLNTDVVPHFEEHGVPIKTVLSDNGLTGQSRGSDQTAGLVAPACAGRR